MPPSTPKRHKRGDLTRDQRLEVLTLRSIDWTYPQIARHLKISERQVQTACQTDHPTPSKRKGRNPFLSSEQVAELVLFVCSSRTNQLMSYILLASGPFTHWGIRQYPIKHALQKEGFRRCIAGVKPPISEANRIKRLQWATKHVEWTRDQWILILWTNETWVTGGRHRR